MISTNGGGIRALAGDMRTFGTIYVGTNGRGILWGITSEGRTRTFCSRSLAWHSAWVGLHRAARRTLMFLTEERPARLGAPAHRIAADNGERTAASIRCEPSDGQVRDLLPAPIAGDCEQPVAPRQVSLVLSRIPFPLPSCWRLSELLHTAMRSLLGTNHSGRQT
jgi:hypothetical protein